jgi:hypothetical protein
MPVLPSSQLPRSGDEPCASAFGATRFRWIDTACLLIGALAGWVAFTKGAGAGAWPSSVGMITTVAFGLSVGAVGVTLARIWATSQLARRLKSTVSDGGEAALGDKVLSAGLRASGLSHERCGPDDLRKALQGTVEAFVAYARSYCIPSALIAFVVPVLTLVDGWLAVQRGSASSPNIGAAAFPMIIGIVSSLVVVVVIETFVMTVRRGVVSWAQGIEASGVSGFRKAGLWESPSSLEAAEGEVISGGTSADRRAPSSMSSDDFKQLLEQARSHN